MTADTFDQLGNIETHTVSGLEAQTLWLKGFLAGLRTASEIPEAGRAKTVIDGLVECIADDSFRTLLSVYRDWLNVNEEVANNRAREAVFLALMEHCAR